MSRERHESVQTNPLSQPTVYASNAAWWPKVFFILVAGANAMLFETTMGERLAAIGPDDLAKAAERIRATDYPQAEEFATDSVLQPRSAAQMLDVFSRAEVK